MLSLENIIHKICTFSVISALTCIPLRASAQSDPDFAIEELTLPGKKTNDLDIPDPPAIDDINSDKPQSIIPLHAVPLPSAMTSKGTQKTYTGQLDLNQDGIPEADFEIQWKARENPTLLIHDPLLETIILEHRPVHGFGTINPLNQGYPLTSETKEGIHSYYFILRHEPTRTISILSCSENQTRPVFFYTNETYTLPLPSATTPVLFALNSSLSLKLLGEQASLLPPSSVTADIPLDITSTHFQHFETIHALVNSFTRYLTTLRTEEPPRTQRRNMLGRYIKDEAAKLREKDLRLFDHPAETALLETIQRAAYSAFDQAYPEPHEELQKPTYNSLFPSTLPAAPSTVPPSLPTIPPSLSCWGRRDDESGVLIFFRYTPLTPGYLPSPPARCFIEQGHPVAGYTLDALAKILAGTAIGTGIYMGFQHDVLFPNPLRETQTLRDKRGVQP